MRIELMRRSLTAVLAVGLLVVPGAASAAPTASPAAPTADAAVLELTPGALPADTTTTLPRRLGGVDRYETSAQVARHTPGVGISRELRLVRADRPLDAAVTPGSPVLYVPPRGPIPASVMSAFRAVQPSVVLQIGDERTLPERQVAGLRGSGGTTRWGLPADALSLSFTTRPFYVEEHMVRVPGMDVLAPGPVAEVAAALANATTPAVVLPRSGGFEGLSRAHYIPIVEGRVRFVGGAASFDVSRQQEIVRYFVGDAEAPRQVQRLAEADRYATAAAAAREAYPRGASRVYVANGHADADAALASAVRDGPVLLVPGCGRLPESVQAVIAEMSPREVVAIGGRAVVCDDMVRQAAAASPPQARQNAQEIGMTRGADCVLGRGRVLCRYSEVGPERQELTGPGDVASVRVTSNTPDYQVHVYGLTSGGELWRWVGSGEGGVGAPERIEPPPSGIVSLAEGDGLPCAITRDGAACLAGEEWVRVPIGRPDQLALSGTAQYRIVVTRHGGTPRVWSVTGSEVTRVPSRGVPSSATDVAVTHVNTVRIKDSAGVVWDFTPLGEFAGRLVRQRMTVDDLAPTTRCGVQAGTRLVCEGWGARAWEAPAGTRIVQVGSVYDWGGDLLVRLSDGRVVTIGTHAELLRGFGG